MQSPELVADLPTQQAAVHNAWRRHKNRLTTTAQRPLAHNACGSALKVVELLGIAPGERRSSKQPEARVQH